MSHRSLASIGAGAVVIAVVSLARVPIAGQAPTGAAKTKTSMSFRTPWGDPDLQGIWSNATVTPFERPSELAGKQVLTDQEAAEFEQRTVQARNQDRRDGAGTDADVSRAYNDFWIRYLRTRVTRGIMAW